MSVDLSPLYDFLPCKTPEVWLEQAADNLPLIMIDHANCEKKAAATAMNLLFKYTDTPTDLLEKMSQLAREELLHFEQVITMMKVRSIEYLHLTPSRYAKMLHKDVRTYEPAKLIDTLIIGALIEARSCERFAALADKIDSIDAELAKYYRFLLKSESRHFEDYLSLAYQVGEKNDVNQRIQHFCTLEHHAIMSPDTELRFHSGPVDNSTVDSISNTTDDLAKPLKH